MVSPELISVLGEGRDAWNSYIERNDIDVPDLSQADLAERRLVGFVLTGANLQGASLRDAILMSGRLNNAILDDADLTGALMGGARLKNGSLRNATLRSADLRDADLEGADLSGADLRDAKLQGCRLVRANLEGALIGANLDQAIVLDSKDIWPKLGGDSIHRLGIRIEVDEHRPHWAATTILIDDIDVLGLEGEIGFDPDQMLNSTSPLLPTTPPRRIALYTCSCGIAGCGCIAPIVKEVGNEVHWGDFRDFVGVYVGPTIADPPIGGTKLDIPDLRFDAQQYRDEVARACADRSWESHGRAVGRLLKAQLGLSSGHFESLGYHVGWVGPYDNGACSIELQRREDGLRAEQVIVTVSGSDGPPADVADTLSQEFLSTPEQEWNITSKGR